MNALSVAEPAGREASLAAGKTAAAIPDNLLACHGCDLLLERREIGPGEELCCPRCGEVLLVAHRNPIERCLVLSLTGLLFLPFAFFMPLMTLDTMGLKNSGNIFDGVIHVWSTGYYFVAVILALTTIVFPLLKLGILFVVSLSLKRQRYADSLRWLMRLYVHLDEWAMLEVYMIGILVTIVKMHHLAHIKYDAGFFCFLGLLGATLSASLLMDREQFWQEIDRLRAAGND
ncbi:MAG: paraquat-inducible protein A [Deltaproteobacteria bacterium]|nr:paraquat-inducible protein A [Deltaproteobacteria bacterium]